MSERRGKIVAYNTANKQGEIEPEGGGPRVKFLLKVVTNKDPEPKPGDSVSFEAPTPRRSKKGVLVQDSATSVTIVHRRRESEPDNPSRLLDKGLRKDYRFREKDKQDFLSSTFMPAYESFWALTLLKQAFVKRWESLMSALRQSGYCVEERRLKTSWRLAVHLGRTSVLENTGIALHRMYGFPIIPGQSLKGLTLAYTEMVVYPKESRTEGQKQVLYDIFGTKDKAGGVMFFDAVPTAIPKLQVDIINCHYPKWYAEGDPPSDDQDPNPVYFLTVAPDSEFLVAVATRRAVNPALAQVTMNLLTQALQSLGAGAKTAAGYGYFQ